MEREVHETDVVVEYSERLGYWLWAFRVFYVDGDCRDFGAGTAKTEDEAKRLAREARQVWEDRNRG